MIGMSPGPQFDVSCSGPNVLGAFIRAADQYCLNFGFLGRGGSDPGAVEETVAGGALGVKIHEDFGASPAVIDGSLIAADRNDFAVHLHTDTINEFGFCEDTLAAIGGRTIHMYHIEGAGGGHAPDLLRVNGFANVIPSSTNPTNPFTAYALKEGVPMTMLAHILNYRLPEDVAFAESRIRPQTMAAEDFLHDMGAISIFAHRYPGHGAAGRERRQVLAARERHEGARRPAARGDDRARRQRAHQALRRQIHDQPGPRRRDRRPCRLDGAGQAGRHRAVAARLVRHQAVDGDQERLRSPGRRWATAMPARPTPNRSSSGRCGARWARPSSSWASPSFPGWRSTPTSERKLGVRKKMLPIRNVRGLRKRDMVRNDAMPHIEVDPQTFEVCADGALLTCAPAARGAALTGGTCCDERCARPEVAGAAPPASASAGPVGSGKTALVERLIPLLQAAAWTSRSSPTTSSPTRTPSGCAAPADRPGAGAARWRPAPARTPSSARTRR